MKLGGADSPGMAVLWRPPTVEVRVAVQGDVESVGVAMLPFLDVNGVT